MARLGAVLLTLLAACAPVPVWEPDGGFSGSDADNPFVHQQGTQLVDGAGEPVTLRGVNLGGWLLWEGWIWGGGWSLKSESDLQARLAQVVGDDEARAFRERVHRNYISEADIAEIARLGFNTVRVPINHRVLDEPAGWDVLDNLLDWCEAHGVRAVLDLHSAPGGQSGYFMADPEKKHLWDSREAQDRTVALWRDIASRYRDRPGVAGYDLINEPDPPKGEALFALYQRIAAAVREVDAQHLIILEGSSAATDFTPFTAPVTHNQAYSFHQYTWVGDSRRDELAKYRDLSQFEGVPMWVGEFGENSLSMIDSTAEMYQESDYDLSGSAFWTWKKVPNGTAYVVGINATMPHWQKLITWLNGGGWEAKPDRDEALQAMDEFIAGVRLENCDEDTSMAHALRARRGN